MDIIGQIFNEIISIFGINEKEANEKGLWEIFERSLISILCEHYGKY